MDGRLSDFDEFFILYENSEGVLFKIRLLTPTETNLDGVLFMYALTNKNMARIQFFQDQIFVVCATMDM